MSPKPTGACYVNTPDQWEAMDDQYCWLRYHSEKCKKPDCEHCNRLAGVKMILLMPFHEVNFVVKRSKQAKGSTV